MAAGPFVAEVFEGVGDFEAREFAVGVTVGGDSLGEVCGGDGGLSEGDAEGVHFRVMGDLHELASFLSRYPGFLSSYPVRISPVMTYAPPRF